MVYGFCGFIGSGKDTAAQSLIEYTQGTRFSFAAVLKDVVSSLFSWDRELLEGTTPESRTWREQEDTYWTKALGFSVTPRKILQLMGTEVFRAFHKDIWIHAAARRLELSPAPVVVFTDARFGNELDFIHERDGKLIWISRPGCETLLPEPLKFAFRNYQPLLRRDAFSLKASGIHASETSFLTEGADKLDVVVINNANLDDLTDCVQHLHDVIASSNASIPIGDPKTTVYLEKNIVDGSFQWSWWAENDQLGRVYIPNYSKAFESIRINLDAAARHN